jgi:hypothetical protein
MGTFIILFDKVIVSGMPVSVKSLQSYVQGCATAHWWHTWGQKIITTDHNPQKEMGCNSLKK